MILRPAGLISIRQVAVIAVLFLFAELLTLGAMQLFLGAAAASDQPSPVAIQRDKTTVWDTANGVLITPRQLAGRIRAVPHVLLGEVHDNPSHHQAQAWLVREISDPDAPKRDALILEMVSTDQRDTLDAFLSQPGDVQLSDLAGLGDTLAWEARGWPAWSMYQPVVAAGLEARLTLRPGNPPTTTTMAVARRQADALPSPERTRLALDRPLADDAKAALLDDLWEGHCGLMPRAALAGMLDVQRLRDATMADAMLADGATGSILIAGHGHVRTDRGVPWYLRAQAPGRVPEGGVVSISMIEVDDPQAFPRNREQHDAAAGDYVWLFPPHPREDPCAGLREKLKSGSGN